MIVEPAVLAAVSAVAFGATARAGFEIQVFGKP